MSRRRETHEKIFSCSKCNTPFVSFPVDDFHTTASLDPNQIDDPIEVTHECENCHEFIKIYWGSRKITFHVG